MLRWPHGGHGDCASARTGYGVRQWARPAGTRVGGRFTALQRHQRCCRFEAFTVVPSWKVLRASDGSAKAENASLAQECGHPRTGGAEACRATMPQPRGVQWAPFWAFCYVITDLPPSLPLPRSDPVTRIRKSSYRREARQRNQQALLSAKESLNRLLYDRHDLVQL